MLYHREFGSGKKLIILHGLFGMSDNWASIARNLSTHFHVFLPDLPNHGKSPAQHPFSYDTMMQSFMEWKEEQQIEKAVVIGHSMGGKLAMKIALEYPDFVEKLIVLDMGMRDYSSLNKQEVLLGKMLEIPLEKIQDRSVFSELIHKKIQNERLENLLLKNIKRSGGHFEWKSNPKIIHDNLPNIYAALHSEKEYNGKTLVIGGELSDYIRKEDVEMMRKHFPQMQFVQLKNAGHWLHVDKRDDFMSELQMFL